MTFSILVRDPETGALGGAAATGSLCVGGWVLRGHINAGLSASQGAAPSTLWGEDVLTLMRAGTAAPQAVAQIVGNDAGRAHRQLSALDCEGQSGVFNGACNTPQIAARAFEGGIASGNMLANAGVIDAMIDGYLAAKGRFSDRLIAALEAGDAAGSDARGLYSSALLVLRRDAAPMSLRIDYSETPLGALRALHGRATSGDYADWASQVPCSDAPMRVLKETAAPD
ncbi:MAG: DUF1028 domain-containing protein [Paracoccaceae bacterium]